MTQFSSLLHQMKENRRYFVERLDHDDSPENIHRLASTHLAIEAIQAVIDEEEGDDAGIEIVNGWPVSPND
jgi:hypothetical protein